jgi:membrane protease YdiL (CAAX protease family)
MWPAALATGAIFAGAHGYGLIGFAAVAWSGTIWAVGYERTGSLLPGMVAHALSNLMSTMSFVVLLRW